MASTSRHALDSRQIHELHDDLDSLSEINQDADIDIIEHGDPHAKINMPDLSHSGGISDDGQGSANVSNDGDASDEDDDNEDWAVWGKMTISV